MSLLWLSVSAPVKWRGQRAEATEWEETSSEILSEANRAAVNYQGNLYYCACPEPNQDNVEPGEENYLI
jgi:hypothetical protein